MSFEKSTVVELFRDIMRREANIINDWVERLGLTDSNAKDFMLVHEPQGNATIYSLYLGGYPAGKLLGRLRVTYTEEAVVLETSSALPDN